jgi:hypothetical protein
MPRRWVAKIKMIEGKELTANEVEWLYSESIEEIEDTGVNEGGIIKVEYQGMVTKYFKLEWLIDNSDYGTDIFEKQIAKEVEKVEKTIYVWEEKVS